MTLRLGVVMDPIGSIKIEKDSTFAMLLAAQARGWALAYMELGDLYLRDGRACARRRALAVRDDPAGWYTLGEALDGPLVDLDLVLMRKDPPFDAEYVYATHLLERAEAEGVVVVNRPRGLRDVGEKLYTALFPDLAPPTLVTREAARLGTFVEEQGDTVLKPLGGFGGASVFRARAGDPNLNVIFETLTAHGGRFAMAQRFIPEIAMGDKRILLIEGEPVPYALARIPAPGEGRGNLAVGGRGEGVALSARDREIAARLGPALREHGIAFAGLDVIGAYLTEVNVTSPTCIRELDRLYGLDIAGQLLDVLAARL
ncbi:MAG: glutathione synthase [Gammaproteobacteria bacterium]|nr:glutathione synthase [Gammaproteobacteria bacterium]